MEFLCSILSGDIILKIDLLHRRSTLCKQLIFSFFAAFFEKNFWRLVEIDIFCFLNLNFIEINFVKSIVVAFLRESDLINSSRAY